MPPALIPFGGDWNSYEEEIYGVFCRTLVDTEVRFEGKPVTCSYHPSSKGKHASFWHCASEGEVEEDRNISLERCERMAWIAWMIENAATSDDIICIRQKRKQRRRVVIVHTIEKYVVVLGEGQNWCALVTAFCIEDWKLAKYLREYESQKG